MESPLPQMVAGYVPAQILYATARLGVADALTGDAQESEELAKRTETDQATLRRLLRALVGLGEVYDFSGFGTIADLGGDEGTLIAAILAAVPGARGMLYDLPAALEGARATLEAAGVADRCEIAEGDFTMSVRPGADAYVL